MKNNKKFIIIAFLVLLIFFTFSINTNKYFAKNPDGCSVTCKNGTVLSCDFTPCTAYSDGIICGSSLLTCYMFGN